MNEAPRVLAAALLLFCACGCSDNQHRDGGAGRNGLQGQVLAVNQGFNFVVLNIGVQQGAVANEEMILTRGGRQIGKVRITSVEPSTSVADIIPGSLAGGVRVEPGDRVIFPGS